MSAMKWKSTIWINGYLASKGAVAKHATALLVFRRNNGTERTD